MRPTATCSLSTPWAWTDRGRGRGAQNRRPLGCSALS
jgi:hypothetical protein